jgi:hypothetical protein
MIELLTDPTEDEAVFIRRLPRVIVLANPRLELLLNLPVKVDDRIMRLGDAIGPGGRPWRDHVVG